MDSFYKFVPKKCLPKDIQGDAPSVEDMHSEYPNLYPNTPMQTLFYSSVARIHGEGCEG